MTRISRIFLVLSMGLMWMVTATQSQTTRATQPASRPAVEITPEAQIVLDRIDTAYRLTQPIKLIAHVIGDFDIADRKRQYKLEITSLADGTGRFIHRAEQVGVVAQTSRALYLYDQKRNAYGYLKTPATRPSAENINEAVYDVLIDENPSLLLSLVTDPARILAQQARKVSMEGPILVIYDEKSIRKIELDEKNLIKKVVIDFSPTFAENGTQNMKIAQVRVNYEPCELLNRIDDAEIDFKPRVTSVQSDLITEKPGHTTSPATKKSTSNNDFQP